MSVRETHSRTSPYQPGALRHRITSTDSSARGRLGHVHAAALAEGTRRPARRPRDQRRRGLPRQARRSSASRSSPCWPTGTSSSKTFPASARRCWPRRSRAASACKFNRIQFTPDLLPGDLIGVTIYREKTGEFVFQPGPALRRGRAGRRDQPGHAADAIRTPRGDERAAGDGGRQHPPARPAVPGRRHAEPARVRGHLSAAGEPARPLPDPREDRLPRPRGRARHPDAAPRRRAGGGPEAGPRSRRRSSRCRRTRDRSASIRPSPTTSSTS